VNKFNEKFEALAESFKSIKYVKREFYPKNFTLSEDFVNAFRREYRRLIDEGIEPRKALVKLNKALLFHTK
jgi:hypothetical protein